MLAVGRWWKLAGVWLLYTAFGMHLASLAPLVAVIEPDLGMSHAAMGAVLGAWQFVYIFAAIPCGLLLDRLGTRSALFIGALLMAASGLARGLAQDPGQLALAVALFGLGGPLISAGAPKVVAEAFRGAQRGLAMGVYITGPGVGAILSLTLSNALLMPLFDGNWRLVVQFWGGISLAAGLFWLVVAGEPRVRPVREPAAGPFYRDVTELLSLPAVRLLLAMSIGVFVINHGLGNWLPELLRATGMDLAQASLLATVPVAVAILSALTVPRLATDQRRTRVLAALFLCSALGSGLLLGGQGLALIGGLVFAGIAWGAMMTILILILVEIPGVGERRAGTAGGLFFSVAEIGGVGGPVLLGLLYDRSGGFASSLWLLVLIALLLMVAVAPLRRYLGGQAPCKHRTLDEDRTSS